MLENTLSYMKESKMNIRFYLPRDAKALALSLDLPCNPPVGSGSLFMIPIFKKMLADGYHLSIVTVSNDCKEPFIYADDRIDLFVGTRREKNLVRGLTFFSKEIDQMVNYARKKTCNVGFALWSYEFALAAEKVDGKKTIVVLHDWAPKIYQIYHDYYRYLRLLMSNKVIRKADKFICVSPYINSQLRCTRPGCKSVIIPNAIEIDDLICKQAGEKILRRVKARIVCANNSFFGLKNVTQSVKIFNKVLSKIPDAELHLYGKGNSEDDPCMQWLIDNKLDKNVFLHGQVDHNVLMQALMDADLFLHASLEESFGLVYIEALLCGTPVFAEERAGAADWILENGRIGKIVNTEAEEQVAEEIVSLLSSENEWVELKKIGLESCIKRFGVDNVYNQWLRVLTAQVWSEESAIV